MLTCVVSVWQGVRHAVWFGHILATSLIAWVFFAGVTRNHKTASDCHAGNTIIEKPRVSTCSCDENRNPPRWRVVEPSPDVAAYELDPGAKVVEMQRQLASNWKRHSSADLDYEEIVK